jgi:hypothetical protein
MRVSPKLDAKDEGASIVVPTQQPFVAVLAVVNLALAIGHLWPPRKQSTAPRIRSARQAHTRLTGMMCEGSARRPFGPNL